MEKLIKEFPSHIRKALELGSTFSPKNTETPIANVLITGLGGSGIGGTIISSLVANECKVPVSVNKGYFLPEWVNKETLVIASSYSGNTEETIEAVHAAMKKNARIVVISSGGTLLSLAKTNGFEYLEMPQGFPPRAAFGFSSTLLVLMFNKLQLIGTQKVTQLSQVPHFLESEASSIMEDARDLASILKGKIPVLYASDVYEGVLVRFRQQLNENSKVLCWHHVLPEMNHNELVGWRNINQQLAVLMFRSPDDYDRIKKRMDFTLEVVAEYTDNIATIEAKGDNRVAYIYYLIHLTDWISVFLAELTQIDPVEVNIIVDLKAELSDFQPE